METYYAINSEIGYIRGLTVSGSLESGGYNLIRNMSDDENYIRALYEFIINNTPHEVSLEKIELDITELM